MKAIKFPEANLVYAKNQKEYLELHVYKDPKNKKGIAISCWKLSFMDIIRIIFSGKLWMSSMTFNKPFIPVAMTTKKSEVLISKGLKHGR